MGGKFGGAAKGSRDCSLPLCLFTGADVARTGTLAAMRLGLPPNSGDTIPNSAKVGMVSLELACMRACTQLEAGDDLRLDSYDYWQCIRPT